MDQESGILRKSLLSLKREKIPFLKTEYSRYRFTKIYKHYIFIFDKQEDEEKDCVVFNTQNGTTTHLKTGMDLNKRSNYSFCHWKNNIFVLFGGAHTRQKVTFGNPAVDHDVYFLYVIEKDGQISFEVESCNLKDEEWWDEYHSAQVYQDNMYIFGQNLRTLNKFDLNERKWSRCQITGAIPIPITLPATVLFGKKVFVSGVATEGSTGKGGLFAPARPIIPSYNSLIALDLENMKWEFDGNLFPTEFRDLGFHPDVVGDKIFLTHPRGGEFVIFDPSNNKFLKSEGISPLHNWTIKSFENHSILFRIFSENTDVQPQLWIEYQHFVTSTQSDPLVATSQQLPHMAFLWKEKPFTDITFVAQNEEIPAHRVILLKSRYFQNMFNSGMIEANSDKINVPDISVTNFKAILEYIYCDKISLTEPLAMELIILADKYFLPNLKADCENHLSTKLTTANLIQVMRVAEVADSEKLEKKVVSFLTSNIEKVRQEVDVHLIAPELFVKAIMDLKSSKK